MYVKREREKEIIKCTFRPSVYIRSYVYIRTIVVPVKINDFCILWVVRGRRNVSEKAFETYSINEFSQGTRARVNARSARKSKRVTSVSVSTYIIYIYMIN